MAKLEMVALSDSGFLSTGSLVGSAWPVHIGISVTTTEGEPVIGLAKSSFKVTMIAPLPIYGFKTPAFLEVAEGIPPQPEGGAGVPAQEDFPGYYVLSLEPPKVGWKEGDYIFAIKVTRGGRGKKMPPDRGQTLFAVHIE